MTLADAVGDRRAGGRARAVLSAALWSLDRVEESRSAAAAAVSRLDGAGELAELARAHAALVRIESIAFNPSQAIDHGPPSVAAAADAGLDEARVDVLISLGLAHGHRGSAGGRADARAGPPRGVATRGRAIQVIRAHVNAVAVAGDIRDGAWGDAVVAEGLPRFDGVRNEHPTALPARPARPYAARPRPLRRGARPGRRGTRGLAWRLGHRGRCRGARARSSR